MDHDLDEKVTRIEDLISKIYPDLDQIENNEYQWMSQWATLADRNSSVDEINDIILSKLPGDNVNYTSIDVMGQEEFLNSLNPSDLPSLSLKLKTGTPIIFLRYLKPLNLCIKTRHQVKFHCSSFDWSSSWSNGANTSHSYDSKLFAF